MSGAVAEAPAPRNLVEVLDALSEMSPELGEQLRGIRTSCLFTAPEVMHQRWATTQIVIVGWARDCNDRDLVERVRLLWNGES